MTKWPVVTVVMSNYNGLSLKILPDTLENLLKNNYPNLEVILVDNASTDKSVETVLKKVGSDKKFKLIQNHINMYSQGLNLGVKNSTGKYVAFFNNDVVVENGFFQKFVSYLEKNPKIALAQGKLINYFDHTVIDSAGETMDEFGNPITIGAGLDAKENFNEEMEVLSVSGSCSIARRDLFEKIGFFDNDYGIGYEDMDLGLRTWLAGFKVAYYPDAHAYHMRGATDNSKPIRPKVRWHFNKNRISTLLKNYPTEFVVANLPVTVLIYIAAGLWETFIKKTPELGSKRFSSLIWVLGNLVPILQKRNQVQKNINKTGANKIQQLLYKKTLLKSFASFIQTK